MEECCGRWYMCLWNQLYLFVAIYECFYQNSYGKMCCNIVLYCVWETNRAITVLLIISHFVFPVNHWNMSNAISASSVRFKRTFQSVLLTGMAAPKWAENFRLLWDFSCFDLSKRKAFLKWKSRLLRPIKWHSVTRRKSEAFVKLSIIQNF